MWILRGGIRRASVVGAAAGALYGLVARAILEVGALGSLFAVMTLGFLVLVPVAIGYLTVWPVERPGWCYRIFAPWIPCALVVLATALAGWEGAICIIMSLPGLLVFSSVGGIAGGLHAARRPRHAAVLALLPFLVGPVEHRLPVPAAVQENRTEIVVDAPPAAVWSEVVEVPVIREEEHRPALYTRMGFPRPVSARLDRPGVGGVRRARFARGVLFLERITTWEEGRRIAFTIDAQTDSIPPTTLDPHVTIGGRYFDVLTGEYMLHPLPDGRTRVILTSAHRVSTTFNPYAGWWAGIIMRSIQANILKVVRDRAERLASGPPM